MKVTSPPLPPIFFVGLAVREGGEALENWSAEWTPDGSNATR